MLHYIDLVYFISTGWLPGQNVSPSRGEKQA